jgi:hypothetical protein
MLPHWKELFIQLCYNACLLWNHVKHMTVNIQREQNAQFLVLK